MCFPFQYWGYLACHVQADIEFLLIDENTMVEECKEKFRWNDLCQQLYKGIT